MKIRTGLLAVVLFVAGCDYTVRNEWKVDVGPGEKQQWCYEITDGGSGGQYVKCFDEDKYNVGDKLKDQDKP